VHRKHGWTTVNTNPAYVALMHFTARFIVRFENVYLPTGCSEFDGAGEASCTRTNNNGSLTHPVG
jgi:hypothetical protein